MKKNYRQRMLEKMLEQADKENHTARINWVTTPSKKQTFEIISKYLYGNFSLNKWLRLVVDQHIEEIDDPELLKLIKEKTTNDQTYTEKS